MKALEVYLREVRDIHRSGAAMPEASYYPSVDCLLNEVGKSLKPRVHCISQLANTGAGSPDTGLFTPDQFQRVSEKRLLPGQVPSRGVVEVKSPADDAWVTAQGEQVSRYWGRYGQVFVTNLRDFVLVGRDSEGKPAKLETYQLAASETEFWELASAPAAAAAKHGKRFEEFLLRVLQNSAPLTTPKDVAWHLASYAREALYRVEEGELQALTSLRQALEQALGLEFKGERGEHFFRSTLVQTLFYGVFSAWVLWCKEHPAGGAPFRWRDTQWHLHVPMIRVLYEQVSAPSQLRPLELVEVLDWAEAALNRVERALFFARFEEEHAVQYFYEPFLQAFDPELRKQLGVWYTPPEIVQYMVERVDQVLRTELQIEDGLADPRVYVLDPCAGTGSYVVEVLKRIEKTLREQRGDALVGHAVKDAAMNRVFGFEILPAPFVVSHLQMGLVLQRLGVPLDDARDERAAVYLTNALTGWEPPDGAKQHLPMPELEEERDAADRVKRETPILVVLGNPPYNGYAGVAVKEERALTTAYRKAVQTSQPQGQGLNDLYVRFFRMAERRIVEQTGRGVVCFISNYSWLDGLSFTAMRERYLDVFDRIWIDNLHGDRIISEYAPDGRTSETVFATQGYSPGIKIGTAISLLVASGQPRPHAGSINYRDMDQARASERRDALVDSLKADDFQTLYRVLTPNLGLGLPFKVSRSQVSYFEWPKLTDLFPVSYPGVQSSRDDFVVDIDRDELEKRIAAYFSPSVGNEAMYRMNPASMTKTSGFDPIATRDYLLKRGVSVGNVRRYWHRPFDKRWIYWEPETKLLDRKREDYVAQLAPTRKWIALADANRRGFDPPFVMTLLGSRHVVERGANYFPAEVTQQRDRDLFSSGGDVEEPNLSASAKAYEAKFAASGQLFDHTVAVLHAPSYAEENAGALRQDWPRVPLPADGALLAASAELGRQIAALLDTETGVSGVTQGAIRPELRAIAVVTRLGGGELNPAAGDLALTAGWGHAGAGGVTMPARGNAIERAYAPEELEALSRGAEAAGVTPEAFAACLGDTTFDIYLNGVAYWRNVPAKVWRYTLGGYQVVKKWLSYREKELLGRDLRPDEAHEVTYTCRRIAALLLLGPALDANYEAVKANPYAWPVQKPGA